MPRIPFIDIVVAFMLFVVGIMEYKDGNTSLCLLFFVVGAIILGVFDKK